MCQCKSGKTQKLNNLDSIDHLQVAFDVYNYHIKDKPADYEFDESERNIMIQTFYSIYPNVKVPITYQHALETIKNIHKQYYGN